MSFEYGPIDTFEVTWSSGHVETVQAHQVLIPQSETGLLGLGSVNRKWMFHGEINGYWRLLLVAEPDDIVLVRNITHVPDTLGGDR